jgi:molecular chaperone DnaK (HSP70)
VEWLRPDFFYCIYCGESAQSLSLSWDGDESRTSLTHDGKSLVHDEEIWAFADKHGKAKIDLLLSRDKAVGLQLADMEVKDHGLWFVSIVPMQNENQVQLSLEADTRQLTLDGEGERSEILLDVSGIAIRIQTRILAEPTVAVLPLRTSNGATLCEVVDSNGIVCTQITYDNPQEDTESACLQLSPGRTRVRILDIILDLEDQKLKVENVHEGYDFILGGVQMQLRIKGDLHEISSQNILEIECTRTGFAEEGFIGEFFLVLALDFGLDPIQVKFEATQDRRFAVEFVQGSDSLPHKSFESLVEGREEHVQIGVKNCGREALDPFELKTDDEWLGIKHDGHGFSNVLGEEKSFLLTLVIDCTNEDLVRRGHGESALRVLSGEREVGVLRVSVGNIVKRTRAQGLLGIDFGTSNTVCAFQRKNNPHPECLSIRDPNYHGPARSFDAHYPSAIAFIDLKDPENPVYETGNSVVMPDSDSASRGSSLKRAIKRRLGEKPISVWDHRGQTTRMAPKKIVELFLKHVFEHAEEAAGEEAPIQFGKITFSYPAGFTRRQLEELELAIQAACTGKVDVKRTADEATIGAIGWMDQWIKSNRDDLEFPCSKSILVYDFGGGTTDISLLTIDLTQNRKGGITMTPRPHGIAGLVKFGGEDVTEALAAEVVKVIVDCCRDEEIDVLIPWSRTTQAEAAKKLGGVADEIVGKSRSLLLRYAEEKKVSGFFERREPDQEQEEEAKDVGLDEIFGPSDSSLVASASGDLGFTISEPHLAAIRIYWRPKSANEGDPWTPASLGMLPKDFDAIKSKSLVAMTDAVEERFSSQLNDALARAHGLASSLVLRKNSHGFSRVVRPDELVDYIDVLLLTGQSSALPSVKESFAEKFGPEFSSRIEFKKEQAKNVVAMGAALVAMRSRRSSLDQIVMTEPGQFCHYPIGVEITGIDGLGFDVWIWNGTKIPGFQSIPVGLDLDGILDEECVIHENPGYWGLGPLGSDSDRAGAKEALIRPLAVLEPLDGVESTYLDADGTSDEDPLWIHLGESIGDGFEILAYVAPEDCPPLDGNLIRSIAEGACRYLVEDVGGDTHLTDESCGDSWPVLRIKCAMEK